MCIIQSLWTRPLALDAQHGKVSGGWPSWDHYWASWVLSAWQAHLTHGTVDLVTDRLGAQILVEDLALPFRHVSLALEEIPGGVHPALWAYGKIVAYEEQAKQGYTSGGGGFVHIDSDVYLWKPLPARVTDAAIAGQHFESAPDFSPFQDVYTRPRKTLSALMRVLPTSWTPYAEEERAINMGIFGGRDLGTITQYCRHARQLVEHPDNRTGWKIMGSVGGIEAGVHNIGWSNMVIEQQTAYCVARQRNVPMTMLFEKDTLPEADAVGNDLGYTHVMGEKRRPASSAFMQRLEGTVADRYPEAWGRIRRGFDVTRQQNSIRHQLSRTGLNG